MKLWTILLITQIGGPLDGQMTGLLLPSQEECVAAKRVVAPLLVYDHKAECVATGMLSASPRPKARPTP